jgi:hypothetical protein
MQARITEFRHPSQLNSLSPFSLFRKRGLGTLKLSPSFDHENKHVWEKELNKHYYACGCSEGSKGLLLFLLGGMIYFGVKTYLGNGDFLMSIVTAFGIALSGAIIGKIAGLYKANSKLKRTVYSIQSHWKVKENMAKEKIVCG